jgi:hypothetical protein
MFNKLFDDISDFIDDPIGTSIEVATKPVYDVIDVIDGLTEGELREKAILRLGIDVVSGMSLNELIEWYEMTYD